MSAGEAEAARDIVAGRIVDRYRNPSRKAYTYLFRLKPDASLAALIPASEDVISAWVDEGDGLNPVSVDQAILRCQHAAAIRPHQEAPSQLTPHQRKQMMARAILFTVLTPAEQPEGDLNTLNVRLVSRALGFSPKGDREAFETWLRTVGDYWYSARREGEDE